MTTKSKMFATLGRSSGVPKSRIRRWIVGIVVGILGTAWIARPTEPVESSDGLAASSGDCSPATSAWSLANEIWNAAFQSDASTFEKLLERFCSDATYVNEILSGIEQGRRTSRDYQIAVGVIDASMRLLDSGLMVEGEKAMLHHRLLDAVPQFEPEYASELLDRWSRQSLLQRGDFEVLVLMSRLEQLRRPALEAAMTLDPCAEDVAQVLSTLRSFTVDPATHSDPRAVHALARLLSVDPDPEAWESLHQLLAASSMEGPEGWGLTATLLEDADPKAAAEHLPRLVRELNWGVPLPSRWLFANARPETVEAMIAANVGLQSSTASVLDAAVLAMCSSRAEFLRYVIQSSPDVRTRALSAQWLVGCHAADSSSWQAVVDLIAGSSAVLAGDRVALACVTSGLEAGMVYAPPASERLRESVRACVASLAYEWGLHPLQRDVLQRLEEKLR
jgi:hypothetical protein